MAGRHAGGRGRGKSMFPCDNWPSALLAIIFHELLRYTKDKYEWKRKKMTLRGGEERLFVLFLLK